MSPVPPGGRARSQRRLRSCRPFRLPSLAAGVLLLGGCSAFGGLFGGGGEASSSPEAPQPEVTESDAGQFLRKRVASKEPPSTLVAQDGTVCTVPADRYESARPGDDVWCLWRSREPAP